jgi:pimeloyl-ACP methyl ester carboxylesterase
MIETKSPPQDQFVRVGGFRARYWQVGQGAPILLLHGIAHSVRAWEQNIDGLAARHTVYALDLIGHGLTDKPNSSYHISDLAKFVRDFMAAVDLPKAHLVGHSMGGAIAMHLAATYPAQVDKLASAARSRSDSGWQPCRFSVNT